MGFLVFLKPFWPLIWRFLVVAAVLAAGVWAWQHFVAKPYIQIGVNQEKAHTQEWKDKAEIAIAANKNLAAQLDDLRAKVKSANDSLDLLAKTSDALIAAKDRIIAAVTGRQRALKLEADRLAAIAAGPPASTKEEACEEATRILDALGRSRNRGAAGESKDPQ